MLRPARVSFQQQRSATYNLCILRVLYLTSRSQAPRPWRPPSALGGSRSCSRTNPMPPATPQSRPNTRPRIWAQAPLRHSMTAPNAALCRRTTMQSAHIHGRTVNEGSQHHSSYELTNDGATAAQISGQPCTSNIGARSLLGTIPSANVTPLAVDYILKKCLR